MIYLFTICEYGGGEIAWCTLTCEEGFADGFERGVRMRINEEVHYIVREEIGEEDLAGHTASHRALDTSSLKRSTTLVAPRVDAPDDRERSSERASLDFR